jgi:hypothetical protein
MRALRFVWYSRILYTTPVLQTFEREMEGRSKPVPADVPKIVFRFCRDMVWLGVTFYVLYRVMVAVGSWL